MTNSTEAYQSKTFCCNKTRRAIWNTIKSSSGNLIEWYDVYVYTVFASYFETQFFDKNTTIYVYAIFAITFLTRPIGSWFFGCFADRRGRRAALTVSILMMALCSIVIAFIPPRQTIGAAAPVILIVCRLIQGFATGGEYGASATYMSELATKDRRGFFSSFQYVTLVGGHVLAQLTLLVVLNVLSTEHMHKFGWHIGFAIGGVAAIIVFWLRRSMDESLSEEQLKASRISSMKNSRSLLELFKKYYKSLLMCFLITLGGTPAFYAYSVTAPAIIKATYSNQTTTATLINLIGLVFLMAIQPIGGMVSDKFGRKPLLLWFGIGGVAYTYILFTYLPKTHSPVLSFILVAIAYIILTGYTSVNALVKAELFPAHVRALGVGIGYALANSIFGGTAPVIYQTLKEHNHVTWFIAYVTFCIAISLGVYIFFLKNKSETYLDKEKGSAFSL